MNRRWEDEAREEVFRVHGKAYAAAVLAGDEVAAEVAIREAMEAGLTTAEIDDEIIAPALWLVGRLWERGEISVADEHLATEISLRVLTLLREAHRTAAERGAHRALLAAPQGELHTMALRMIGDLLREAGYGVLMLGADVPAHALAASAVRHRPDLVCLSATMPDVGDRVLLSLYEVQQDCPSAGFLLGGRGISRRLRAQQGVEICERVGDAVEAADALVKRSSMN